MDTQTIAKPDAGTTSDRARQPKAGTRGVVRHSTTLLVVATVIGTLAVIGMKAEPYGPANGEQVPPVVVAVEEARKLDGYSVAREFVGVVEARRESGIGFQLAGEIAAILVDEGDEVEAHALVARLDTSILDAERRTFVAARDQARASMEMAEITRRRMRDALDRNAVSTQEFDEADKDFQARIAGLARADAVVASIDVRIAKATLRAPYAALVAARLVDEGQVLGAGVPVLRLLERTEPEVRIGVAGDAIDAVVAGRRFEIVVRDRRIPATVRSVLPVRGNGTRSVDVVLTLHTELNGIRRGDLGTLTIDRTRAEPGFWLPLSALTESSRGLWACYVAEELSPGELPGAATHRLRRRELEIIHQEADRVFVRGTLADGELIVTEGMQRLVPDQLVRLATGDGFTTLGSQS